MNPIALAQSTDGMGALIMGLGWGGFGAVLLWFAARSLRRYRDMRATPTSPVATITDGPVEVKGRAVGAGGTFTAPLTGAECLAYRFTIERQERRRRSNGSTSTRWVTEHEEARRAPFIVEDATGAVRVDPEGAELDLHDATCVRSGSALARAYEARKNGAEEEPGLLRRVLPDWIARHVATGKPRRYTEVVLEEGQALYVLGTATRQQAGGRLEVRGGADDAQFLVSDRSENHLQTVALAKGTFLSIIGGAMAAFGLLFMASLAGVL